MTEEARARDDIARVGRSLFDRGLTHGATGNISVRLSDGRVLVTPTGSSLGNLDPAALSLLSPEMTHLSGDQPTKETPLHAAFYATRAEAGAVVHLHGTHSVALSIMPDIDPEQAVPPLTPYVVMKVGKVALLPFFVPGDPAMGEAVRALQGRRAAVLLAHHGPVVSGRDLSAASEAAEELEATAKLALLVRGLHVRALTFEQISAVAEVHRIAWE